MNFIDVHSHVLPGMDDGSPDVETSLAMLRKWRDQGVEKIIATPHFDFRDISVDSFIAKRRRSFEKLSLAMRENGEKFCEIELGAEVMYSSNIFGFIDLSALSIGETPFVLLEFATELTSEKVSTILSSHSRSDMSVILAHTERYRCFGFMHRLKKLRNADIRFQVNFSSFFPDSPFRRTADAMMKNDMVDLFATDAHSIKTRPPEFADILCEIRREYGKRNVDRILERSVRYFG